MSQTLKITDMKTVQDLTASKLAYTEKLKAEIANINRMEAEYTAVCIEVSKLVPALEPVLRKLHLEIIEFHTMQPRQDEARTSYSLSLTLRADDKFKFILDQGYNARGESRNRARIDKKAGTLSAKVVESLKEQFPGIRCGFNCYSLEHDPYKTTQNKNVLASVGFEL